MPAIPPRRPAPQAVAPFQATLDPRRFHGVVLVLVAYVLCLWPLYRAIGDAVFFVSIAPLLVAASLLGSWPGIAVALLLSGFNGYLAFQFQGGFSTDWLGKALASSLLHLILGGVVGRWHDTALRLRSELRTRQDMEAKLEFLAYHDPLTGLSNRLRFHDRLELELAHSRRNPSFVSVLFLNLDHFKGVNDSLGHDVGDHLLIEVGHRIQRCLRQSDTVARFGDDSFVVLLPRLRRQEDVGTVAEKITDSLGQPFFVLGQEIHILSRVGVASYPDDGEDPETLLRNANAALNQAKALGTQTFQIYNPRINQEARERMALETGIRKCLAQEELLLHYQPIIDTATGGIHSLEALLRWQHPDRGTVSPDRFIPIAEDTGMIHPIGDWVLRTAARQLRVWLDLGFPDLRMAVNLSPKQLRRAGLWREFADTIAETRLHPSQFELEITESSLLGQEPQVMENLRGLRQAGFGLALDDFGTGYSCLSYLKRLPLTALKVDRSFIREITTDPDYASITYAIIAIAKALGLRTVAEGVENQEQCQFLWSAQCDAIQGFLFNKPMVPDEITVLLMQVAERRNQYQRHFPQDGQRKFAGGETVGEVANGVAEIGESDETMPATPDFTPRPRESAPGSVAPEVEKAEGLSRFYP